jgi:hypothetical protein
MARDLAAFVADPVRCGVVLTALAEEMPVQEALELIALLREKIGRQPELVVANALYPAFPSGTSAGRFSGSGATAVLGLWRQRRAVNDRELKRLRADWSGPITEVPLLPLDRGPALLAGVEAALRERWS